MKLQVEPVRIIPLSDLSGSYNLTDNMHKSWAIIPLSDLSGSYNHGRHFRM